MSESWDKTLKIWDVNCGTCKATLEGHSGLVYAVDWFFDRKMLVRKKGQDGPESSLWDIGTGKELEQVLVHSSPVRIQWNLTSNFRDPVERC